MAEGGGDVEGSCDQRAPEAPSPPARHDADGFLLTDRHQRTSVAGLYAAGDVVQGLNQIGVATGGAAIAASAMHRALATGFDA